MFCRRPLEMLLDVVWHAFAQPRYPRGKSHTRSNEVQRHCPGMGTDRLPACSRMSVRDMSLKVASSV